MKKYRFYFSLLIAFAFLVPLIVAVILIQRPQELREEAELPQADLYIDATDPTSPAPTLWSGLAQGGEEVRPMLGDVTGLVRQIQPNYIRIDHIYDHFDVIKQDSQGRITYDWSELDVAVQEILDAGALPYLSLSYMPPEISSGSEISLPITEAAWRDLVRATIRHYSSADGMNLLNVYYEVWNEPDHFGAYTIGGQNDYRILYRGAAHAANQVRNAQVFYLGGPAITHLNKDWLKAFLNFVKTEHLRLDFISWHVYDLKADKPAKDAFALRDLVTKAGISQRSLIVSEWGPSAAKSRVYGNRKAAAHAVATIDYTDDIIDRMYAFEIKDGPRDTDSGWGMIGHQTNDLTLKPRYQTFKLLAPLSNHQLPISGETEYVRALAGRRDPKTIYLVAANYSPSNQDTSINVPLTINRLYNGTYRITTERVTDAGTISTQSETVNVTSGIIDRAFHLATQDVIAITVTRLKPPIIYAPVGAFGIAGDTGARIGSGADFIYYPLPDTITLRQGTAELFIRPNWDVTTHDQTLFEIDGQAATIRATRRTRERPPSNAFSTAPRHQNIIEFGLFSKRGDPIVTTVAVVPEDFSSDWHHLAFNWQNVGGQGLYEIFIDGNRLGSSRGVAPPMLTGPVAVGSGLRSAPVSGDIDEFRLSNAIRYPTNFVPTLKPFSPDASSVILEHFNPGRY